MVTNVPLSKSNFVGKYLRCGESKKEIRRLTKPRRWQFWDYSWLCPRCKKFHCSNCHYGIRGLTITVYDCGRFDD